MKNMSLALLIGVHMHCFICFYTVNRLRCVVELLLFCSSSRDHCRVTLMSLHCLAIRYLFNGILAWRGVTVIFLW
jgi:hypothetical protein